MAGGAKKLVDVGSVNAVAGTSDSVFVNANGAVKQVIAQNAFSNTNLKVATIVVGNTSTPANSTINATPGTIWFDSSFLYICVANNTIKRVSLGTF